MSDEDWDYKEINRYHTVITFGTTVSDYWASTGKYIIRRSGKSEEGYGLKSLERRVRFLENREGQS